MGIFGTLFFIILFVLLAGLLMIVSIVARLFGGIRNLWNVFAGKGNSSYGQQGQRGFSSSGYQEQKPHKRSTSTNQSDRPHSKGVFADDEGTYVDFEEVVE